MNTYTMQEIQQLISTSTEDPVLLETAAAFMRASFNMGTMTEMAMQQGLLTAKDALAATTVLSHLCGIITSKVTGIESDDVDASVQKITGEML